MPNSPAKVALSRDTLLRPVGEEAVLLNLKTGLYFSLNPVGLRMLEVLTHTDSLGKAICVLQAEYEVDPAELQSDLHGLLESLRKQGLVEIV